MRKGDTAAMMRTGRPDSGSQSCSCTSCVYKSESEQPSIRKYIARGSRIDRLYYGKYIPLRERKLLNRLVRTRAVYDDLRARLLSDSTSSVDNHSDSKPEKQRFAINTLDDSGKSSAILELVDFIDKGAPGTAALGPIECCSCCSCSSEVKILESDKKPHKYRRSFSRGFHREYGGRLQPTKGERYNKRGLILKAKHIRSEPCTCTFKFSGLIKKHSKTLFRKIHPAPALEPFQTTEERPVIKQAKFKTIARKSFKKYKGLQDKLEQDIRTLNEYRINMNKNLQLHAKKSLEQVKHVKGKIHTNIESGIRKSLKAVKALQPKDTFETLEYPDYETDFKIRKDSIVKFKDYLKRKDRMKDWECDLECKPDTCVPEECFKILKLRRSSKPTQQRGQEYTKEYEIFNRNVKVGGKPLRKSSTSVQAEQFVTTTNTNTKKSIIHFDEGKQGIGQRMIFKTSKGQKAGVPNIVPANLKKKQVNESLETHISTIIDKGYIPRGTKRKSHIQGEHKTNKLGKFRQKKNVNVLTRKRQPAHENPPLSDAEFYTARTESKIFHKTHQPDIHYVPRHIRRIRQERGSQTVLKPSFEALQHIVKAKPKKYAVKLLQKRELNQKLGQAKTSTDRDMKSPLSLTKKLSVVNKERKLATEASLVPVHQKLAINDNQSSGKQVVRIGSTFSFSMEFSKLNSQDDHKTSSAVGNIKETRSKSSSKPYKANKVKGSLVKVKYKNAKTTLNRCLCILKSHTFVSPRRKIKTSTTGTVMSFTNIKVPMLDKDVETKKRRLLKQYQLLPYECEPGICIPEECDPMLCYKIIQLRNRKTRKSKESYTSSRKTKSTSSLISKSVAPVKAKAVQSSVAPMKLSKGKSTRKNKDNFGLARQELNRRKSGGRQAVRIGSSFSFNIEFYKDKTPIVAKGESVSNVSKDIQVREYGLVPYNKKNKGIFVQENNLDKNLGPTDKKRFWFSKSKHDILKRPIEKSKFLNTNTQTLDKMLTAASRNRATKNKWKQNYELLPYECEPFSCEPGICDPYLCFERIKRRTLNGRDYGMLTDKATMRSVSSFVESPYKKSAGVEAQPKQFVRGTNIRDNYNKALLGKPREVVPHMGEYGEIFRYSDSRQSVKLGSSFNFSIEFSKELPHTLMLKKTKNRQATKMNPKNYKDKGIKVTRVKKVNNIDSQSQKARKVNKSSLVRPMLKRCFCTLNLYKQTKQQNFKTKHSPRTVTTYFGPKVYTVNRTKTSYFPLQNLEQTCILYDPQKKMPSISTSSFLLQNYARSLSKYSTLKLHPVFKIPLKLRQPIKISSNLSVEIEFVRKCCPSSLYSIQQSIKSLSYAYLNNKPQQWTNALNQSYHQSPEKLIGISQYLERCYCTMNLQILHTRRTGRKRNNQLKPYECEPGICVPGECDPFECQKLIMKRLMKNVSKGSSTETTNKSVSSYVPQSGSDSRSTQFKRRAYRNQNQNYQRDYQPQELHKLKQRQAVRVSSSFTINVDFSKNRSSITDRFEKDESKKKYNRPIKHKPYKFTDKGAPGIRIVGKDRQLQSDTISVDKASNYTPKVKRCFCTLKLQKRGRIHEDQFKFNARHVPSISSRSIKVGTKKAKYHNIPVIDSYNLKPYECEPGICVPGECDPYKCLEIMESRKEIGISAISLGERSVTSMTSDRVYNKRRTRAVNVKPRNTHKKTKIKKVGIFEPMKRHIGISESVKPHISEKSARQAVRIGSNFSFNIEFYKDSPQTPKIQESFVKVPNTKIAGTDASLKRQKRKLDGRYSQSTRHTSHRFTQKANPTNQATTMTTSFIRRCFCTAKLLGIDIPKHHSKFEQKKKHWYIAGLPNRLAQNNQNDVEVTQSVDKETNTNKKYNVHIPRLEPYECEPGICIPGQCDPYLCNEIIQRRLAKHYSKASGTESAKTQSVSSSYRYIKQPKNERIQARILRHDQEQYISKERLSGVKTRIDTDKKLVRIGSNFNFNIEFYKENLNNDAIIDQGREIKNSPNRNMLYKKHTNINHVKNTGTESMIPTLRGNESQVKRRETRSFGVSPLIKRCFCTLKLLNKTLDRASKLNKLKSKRIATRNAETQSHKLLVAPPSDNILVEKGLSAGPLRFGLLGNELSPYECEPFTCIPGECNPIECLERIKSRQQDTRDFSTFTEYPVRKSVGNFVSSRTRDQNLQAMAINRRLNKGVGGANYEVRSRPQKYIDKPRQAVRIGSNFSFNIEFFKENSAPEITTNRPFEDLSIKQYQKKNFKKIQKKSQSPSYGRDADSQSASMNVRSTNTALAHFKRCFCTLQLRNKEVRKSADQYKKSLKADHYNPPKSKHSAVDQVLKKLHFNKVGKLQNQPGTPAVKYKIKGTSTKKTDVKPNQIVKPIRILEPYECEPNICVPGECDPYECLKRMQRRQVRDFGTEYKQKLKHTATASIKRPETLCKDAQCLQERRLHSRATSFPAKRRRRIKEENHFISQVSDETNRQAVRIGSNFSFNIEFFKENRPMDNEKIYDNLKIAKMPEMKTRSEMQAKSRGSYNIRTRERCQGSQCPFSYKKTTSSAVNTSPKRCFCTAQLFNPPRKHRFDHRLKSLQSPPLAEHKTTATKNKYIMPHELGIYECPPLMCIPGECDPYDCLRKLKRRGIHKSRSVGTRTAKTSIAAVGNRIASKAREHRVQAKDINKENVASTIHSNEILNSLEIAQNMDRQNKRAVRIASNFNFNIDFSKQQSQPVIMHSPKIVSGREKHEDSKSYLNKTVAAKAGKYQHHDSQKDLTKTKNQGSDAGNILKRCFCTLQLQKHAQRKVLRNNLPPSGAEVKYPQIITVGRVEIKPLNTNLQKNKLLNNIDHDRSRSTSINQKLLNKTRSISTKTEKKYLRNRRIGVFDCDPSNCPNYTEKPLSEKRIKHDMETILPYTASKFHKKESKTFMSNKKKIKKTSSDNVIKTLEDNKPHETLLFQSKSKRLTAKKSKKSLDKLDIRRSFNNSSFFGRCTNFFSQCIVSTHNPGKQGNAEYLSYSKPPSMKVPVTSKKSKSIKSAKTLDEGHCRCPKHTGTTHSFFSKFQSTDAVSYINPETEALYDNKSKGDVSRKSNRQTKPRVTFADNVKSPKIDKLKEKKKKLLHHKSSTRSKLCYSCSVNDCPYECNKHSLKTTSEDSKSLSKSHDKYSTESNKRAIVHSGSAGNCQYCVCCKRKIDVDEVSKGAGDKLLTFTKYGRKFLTTAINNKDKTEENSLSAQKTSQKTSQLTTRKTAQKTAHTTTQTTIQKTKRRFLGAKISVPAKGTPKSKGVFGKLLPVKKVAIKTSKKPCICGSKKCAKASTKMIKKKASKPWIEHLLGGRPCVCGSTICTQESNKIKEKLMKQELLCSCKQALAERDAEEKRQRELKKRFDLEYEKALKKRKKRIQRNKELEKKVKQSKKSSDLMLAASSVVDVTKLGFSTIFGGLRRIAKAIYQPRYTYEHLKHRHSQFDPELAIKQLAQDYMESDTAATAKRIKMRLSFMKNVQEAKKKLEENRYSHFLIHMADPDPKTRKFKPKPKRRVREPVDFNCSLYMASLRRKRFLSVYRRWPWFYPHFITLINIWKQFTDIMLFLLAVVVWSPCILCMEACRAMTCCFFCTG